MTTYDNVSLVCVVHGLLCCNTEHAEVPIALQCYCLKYNLVAVAISSPQDLWLYCF
jgi:hypothetical protein